MASISMSHFFVDKCHVVVTVCLHSGTGLKVQTSIPNWNAESFSLQGFIFCFQAFMWWFCVIGVGCICLIDEIVTVSVTSVRMFVQFLFSGVFCSFFVCWGWWAVLLFCCCCVRGGCGQGFSFSVFCWGHLSVACVRFSLRWTFLLSVLRVLGECC